MSNGASHNGVPLQGTSPPSEPLPPPLTVDLTTPPEEFTGEVAEQLDAVTTARTQTTKNDWQALFYILIGMAAFTLIAWLRGSN